MTLIEELDATMADPAPERWHAAVSRAMAELKLTDVALACSLRVANRRVTGWRTGKEAPYRTLREMVCRYLRRLAERAQTGTVTR